ncbi:hypothetical protein ACEPAH_3935 [Sanghuangporus vaninii]
MRRLKGLIRWGIVEHGFVDGNSRLITGLQASDNDRGETALQLLFDAARLHKVPIRLRGDHGVENILHIHRRFDVGTSVSSIKPTAPRGTFAARNSVYVKVAPPTPIKATHLTSDDRKTEAFPEASAASPGVSGRGTTFVLHSTHGKRPLNCCIIHTNGSTDNGAPPANAKSKARIRHRHYVSHDM